jgi:hypothetical protein
MTTVCCYCDRILDIKRLTSHKILIHKLHEKPENSEVNYMIINHKYYYFPKFYYDDGYVNIPYDEGVNINIVNALFNNMTKIEVEFKKNNMLMNHMINLQTMKIIDLDNDSWCCLKKNKEYELVVDFNPKSEYPKSIYRDTLFNKSTDEIYPLRTEYFNHVLSRLPNKDL